jgi:hypothetical protein
MRKGESDLDSAATHVKGRPNMAHAQALRQRPTAWLESTRPMPDDEGMANSTSGVRQMPPPWSPAECVGHRSAGLLQVSRVLAKI